MSEERDFEDFRPELMRGAPLLPAGSLEEEQGEIPASPDPREGGYPGDSSPDGKNPVAIGKAIIRQAIVSGRAEAALSTVATAAEKTKEGIEVLVQILNLAKIKLGDVCLSGEGITASQAEMFWRLIKVLEFQHLTAGMLARLLAE